MKNNLAYANALASNDVATTTAATLVPTVSPVRSDVQSLWRKRGWRPPSEYRQDFAQSCRPAIYAGMVRLELASRLPGQAA